MYKNDGITKRYNEGFKLKILAELSTVNYSKKKLGEINVYTEQNYANTIITVSDNGIGIDKTVIPKLWEFSDNYSTEGTINEK